MVLTLAVVVYGVAQTKHFPRSEEDILYAKTSALMKSHVELLRKAGRWPLEGEDGQPDAFSTFGRYDWHFNKSGEGYFGAYSFYQPAFDQAARSWFFHGQMAEGSDILVNVGHGEFDKSIVGYTVGNMTYCSLHGGELHHCFGDGFAGGKVTEFIDATHIRLDHRARWDAEMYGLATTPPDYQDMCACHDLIPFQSTTPPTDEKSKPCSQGGNLDPGESCSIPVRIQMSVVAKRRQEDAMWCDPNSMGGRSDGYHQYHCVPDDKGPEGRKGRVEEDKKAEAEVDKYEQHKFQLASYLTTRVLTDAEYKEVLALGSDIYVRNMQPFYQQEIDQRFEHALRVQELLRNAKKN